MNPKFKSALLLLILVCLSIPSFGQLIVKKEGNGFSVSNQGLSKLVDLEWGPHSIDILTPGSSWDVIEAKTQVDLTGEVRTIDELSFSARFSLEEWEDALDRLPGDQIWAEVHLKTAGIQREDNYVLSLFGAPRMAEHILALRQVSPEIAQTWFGEDPLRQGLAAFATRYTVPGPLLDLLMENNPPDKKSSEVWPPEYRDLPQIKDSIRAALEAHELKSVALLIKYPKWSKDRGFDDLSLLFALIMPEKLAPLLIANAPTQADRLFDKMGKDDQKYTSKGMEGYVPLLKELIDYQQKAKQEEAIKIAVRMALLWKRHNVEIDVSQSAQLVCAHLDLGASKAINEKQLLAAQAYINLSEEVCHGISYYRARVTEYFRVKGDGFYFDGDYETAQHWYRGAVLIGNEVPDRARLIDALSQLALIYQVQGLFGQAKDLIKEARSLEVVELPQRELLMFADRVFPKTNNRLQIGLMVMAAILGFVALLKILEALFGWSRP